MPAGRTTFVNTLCNKKVLEGKDADDAANAHIEEGVKIKPVTVGMFRMDVRELGPIADHTQQSLMRRELVYH